MHIGASSGFASVWVFLFVFLLTSGVDAATIVMNNTGLDPSSFVFLDNNDSTVIDNRLGPSVGGGNDGASFGQSYWFSGNGGITLPFDGLPEGTYYVYATWPVIGGQSQFGIDVTADSSSFGNFDQDFEPDASFGFSAYDEVNDPPTEVRPFQRLGSALVGIDGSLDVVLARGTGDIFGRYDAVAVALVPEPTTGLLIGLGLAMLGGRVWRGDSPKEALHPRPRRHPAERIDESAGFSASLSGPLGAGSCRFVDHKAHVTPGGMSLWRTA